MICKFENDCLNKGKRCEECIHNNFMRADYFDCGYNVICNRNNCKFNRFNKCQYKKECKDTNNCTDYK